MFGDRNHFLTTFIVSVGFAGLTVLWLPGTLTALQVLSPSVNKPNSAGNQSGAGAAANGGAEPSKRLLEAMDTMTPFEVVGGEFEAPVLDVARKFMTGTAAETMQALESVCAMRKDFPPVPLMMASMFYTAGKVDEGKLWLEKTAADFPDHPSAFLAFAKFASNEKRVADCVAMIEKAERIMSAGTWTDEQKKMFQTEYLDVKTDIAVQRQQLDDAKKYLVELKQLVPENTKVAIRLAQVEFDLGNVDESVKYLTETRAANTELRVPEVIIAEWFMKKKNIEDSEKWMVSAATKYPDNGDVQLDYARWLLQNEKIPEALEAVNKAESLKANDYVVGFLKGQISFARQTYDMAEMYFDELNRKRPGDADAVNMLALSLIESEDQQKHSRALELAAVNQRLYPRSPTALATLGWIYYRTGKISDAENAFRQVIAANSLESASSFFVATYLDQKGEYANAKQLLEQSLANEEYFMFRGAAKRLLGTVSAKVPADPSSDKKESALGDPAK